MYLQRMMCMGVHMLCCLGTQDISMRPDDSALAVYLFNEYEVKYVDDKKNVIVNKTYRFNTCVQWDRNVLGRAVKMLRRQQVHVDVEEVETILRAMASQSTYTESAHVHDSIGTMEALWNREVFAGVIEKLGGLQSKVDGEEVEAILHAMMYQSTGKVDIVHVSGYMEKIAKHDGESYEIRCDAEIFEKTYNIMIEKKQEKVNADDMVKILHLMEHLKIEEKWKWACYDKLARKTKEDNKETAKYAKNFVEEVKGRGTKIESFSLYMQHLLRLYAEEHGMSLTADEEKKTLDLWCTHSKKDRRENRTEDWTLRVEVSEKYRRQTEVQEVAEVLMEVMNMAVEVDIEEWKPEDRGMLEKIACKGKKTELRIKCRRAKPGAIAEHMQSLKNKIIELDVSGNISLSNEDWETVGEMTSLKKLKVLNCSIEPGTITKHMQSLKNNLVDLDVTWNENMDNNDWKTAGEMTRLKTLNISGCSIRAGTIAMHMQTLKNNLVELDISWNRKLSDEDWKTVGEMTKLEKLKMQDCNVKPGTITNYMQSLKNNLVELDVTGNRNLSDEDWKTVGEMKKLEKLKMQDCNVKPGTITKHMQGLKSNLVELDVSMNANLSNEDWKTVGEMTRLKMLNIKCCNVQAGTITKHMKNQKNNLVELDVSLNRNLSNEDWKIVEEITGLDRKEITSYGVCD
eukprot:jgi/Antlo1/725/515